MRRLMLAVAVTAALTLSTAAPAVAAPTKNPNAFDVTMTCGDEFHDTTTGKVGFLEDGPAGAIGMAFGGTYYLYTADDELVLTVVVAPPPGLLQLGKLEACTSYVTHGDTYSVWDPLYIMRTPNSPF